MSPQPPKMAFAQKMMAKMGHVEGQGLGKSGSGIVDPVQSSGKFSRAGLGFEVEEHFDPRTFAPQRRERTEWDDKIESRFVHIQLLPCNCEPKYVMTLFGAEDKQNIEELYTPKSNHGGQACVVFKTEEDAADAAVKYNLTSFGPNGQKVSCSLIAEDTAPFRQEEEKYEFLCYSDMLHEIDPAEISATVLVTNLPTSGPISNIYQMIEKLGWDEPGFRYGYDYEEDEGPHGIKHTKIVDDGVLVQFESTSDGQDFRSHFDGEYWKNDTLHVEFYPNEDMEDLLEEERERKAATKESTKLFVGNVRGLTAQEICQAFHPVVLNDVQVNAGGFAFVFLEITDAVKVLDKYPNGIKLRAGRKIYPNPLKDAKGVKALAAARAKMASQPAFATPAPTTPVAGLVANTASMTIASKHVRMKLNNLAPWTTEQDILSLFKDFSLSGPQMSLKQGYGFVWLATEAEAKRAVTTLNKRTIRGKTVTLKIAGGQ